MQRTWKSYVTRGAQVLSHRNVQTYLHYITMQYITSQYIIRWKYTYIVNIFNLLFYCFKIMSVYKSKEKMKITFFKMGTSPKSSEFTCLHYITVYYITLQYITLHYSKVQHITLHYSTLHYITVHYSKLHYIHAQDLVHKNVCHQRGTSPMSCHHGFTSGPCRTKENQT